MQDASGCDATGHGRKGYAGYPPPQRGNESTAARRARLAYLSPCAPLSRPIPRATSRPFA